MGIPETLNVDYARQRLYIRAIRIDRATGSQHNVAVEINLVALIQEVHAARVIVGNDGNGLRRFADAFPESEEPAEARRDTFRRNLHVNGAGVVGKGARAWRVLDRYRYVTI